MAYKNKMNFILFLSSSQVLASPTTVFSPHEYNRWLLSFKKYSLFWPRLALSVSPKINLLLMLYTIKVSKCTSCCPSPHNWADVLFFNLILSISKTLIRIKDCATFLIGNQTAGFHLHVALQVSLLLVWFRFTYEIAPVFVLMEQLTLKKMREIVGWPDGEGDGIFSPGKISTNDQPPMEAHVHENSKNAIIKLYSWCKMSRFKDERNRHWDYKITNV